MSSGPDFGRNWAAFRACWGGLRSARQTVNHFWGYHGRGGVALDCHARRCGGPEPVTQFGSRASVSFTEGSYVARRIRLGVRRTGAGCFAQSLPRLVWLVRGGYLGAAPARFE
jgi:hypothetical protein